MSEPPRAPPIGLPALAVIGFALRAAVRFVDGPSSFWVNGYSFYFDLARNLAHGMGLTLDGQTATAFRVPAYPIFVALVTRGERAFAPLVLAQSLLGGATVMLGGLLARELFGAGAALLSGATLAVYPYYVVHDTALQETSLFTLLTLSAMVLLVRARRRGSPGLSAAAGAALAGAVLTRSTLAPFACVAPLWLLLAVRASRARRARCAAVCAALFVLGLCPWLAYQRHVTGRLGLGTETGYMLWRGQNPYTFSRYPQASMDESAAVAAEALTVAERGELEALPGAEGDAWFLRRGLAFMAEDPMRTLISGMRKIVAAFGVLPSPRHTHWQDVVFALSYGPVLLFGLCGLWLTRKDVLNHGIVYALFVSFAATTFVFFGHTSHRAFLDVYLIVYATVPIGRWRRVASSSTASAILWRRGHRGATEAELVSKNVKL